MIWIVLLIVAAVMGVVIYFAMKSHNKMVADGKIISRRTNFMENAEEFTLTVVEPERVTEAVRAMSYADMHIKMQCSNSLNLPAVLGRHSFISLEITARRLYIVLSLPTGKHIMECRRTA